MMAEHGGFLVWCTPAGMGKQAVSVFLMQVPGDEKGKARQYVVVTLPWQIAHCGLP